MERPGNELAKNRGTSRHPKHKDQGSRVRALPWVRGWGDRGTELTPRTEKTLVELFTAASQLMAYKIMFGPTTTATASLCPGCTSSGRRPLDGVAGPPNHRDVTLLCSRARRSSGVRPTSSDGAGSFPRVNLRTPSSRVIFELALTEEQAQQIPGQRQMVDDPTDWW